MEKTRGPSEIILDANVLIDFFIEDPTIIQLVNNHIGNVLIPKPILRQVKQLTLADCEKFGLTVFKPSLDMVIKARKKSPGRNYPDMLCFFEAKARQIPLYTNDKKLLNYSLREKVNAFWGLELLIILFKGGYIAKDEVLGIAQNICERTPYPTEKIMDEFRRRI